MGAWLQEFFHAPVDLSSLALFRILIGGLIAADAVSYGRSAELLLHPHGLFPFDTWRKGPDQRYFSVFRWLPASPRSVTGVLLVYALAGFCLSIGLGTRWAAGTAFLMALSLHHRNRYALHSGDALLRVLTFLLAFSDAGRLWSVDALLAPPAVEVGSPVALRLMQIQLAVLYLASVRFKLQGRTWREGTATHYATHLLAHRRRRLPVALDGIGAHRMATWATLAVEVMGGALIWFRPTRYVALVGLIGLHLGLQVLMRMHLFQWIMLAALTLFVPGTTTARLISTLLGD